MLYVVKTNCSEDISRLQTISKHLLVSYLGSWTGQQDLPDLRKQREVDLEEQFASCAADGS